MVGPHRVLSQWPDRECSHSAQGRPSRVCRSFAPRTDRSSHGRQTAARRGVAMTRGPRHGFSLLEVLLATGIMIGSAIVLMELVSIGSRHASSARDLAKSQLICQTKLNEILAHVTPIETSPPTPCEDDPKWMVWVDL